MPKLRLPYEAAHWLLVALAALVAAAVSHPFDVLSFPWIAWSGLGFAAIVVLGREVFEIVPASEKLLTTSSLQSTFWLAAAALFAYVMAISALADAFSLKWWVLLIVGPLVIETISNRTIGQRHPNAVDWDCVDRAFADMGEHQIVVLDRLSMNNAEALDDASAAARANGKDAIGCLFYTVDDVMDDGSLLLRYAVLPHDAVSLDDLTTRIERNFDRHGFRVELEKPGRLRIRMRAIERS